ncbi:hypothetical protein [uncultured Cardiobacterium sp.]|jgi:hypothetical protein|uniref:hypothetical protein n=1 Tax=uncultured Cardiobacterium sp. TaxID=417619 RepID=UPI002608DA3D|nr:hypothetical protein [uncultured Cardiobacterium sp.]
MYVFLTVFFMTCFLVVIFLGFTGFRNLFFSYLVWERISLFLIFIAIILQLYSIEVIEKNPLTHWQVVTLFSLIYSILSLVVLFKKYKKDDRLIEIVLVMGIMQIAIAMILASTNGVSVNLKLWANACYLTIPVYVFHELTKNNSEKINNKNGDQDK